MISLDQLKEKINDALLKAEQDDIDGFKKIDQELVTLTNMYSQQISNTMPESYNLVTLQMGTLKYTIMSVLVALCSIGALGFLTINYVHNDNLTTLFAVIIGIIFSKYLWNKVVEIRSTYEDFKTMSIHNSALRSHIANCIKCLHQLKWYETQIHPKILDWKNRGLYTDEQYTSNDQNNEMLKNIFGPIFDKENSKSEDEENSDEERKKNEND